MIEAECIKLLTAEKLMMIAVSTGGPRIEAANPEYVERRQRINFLLQSITVSDPNCYSDLWGWYAKWSSGELPTYSSRRQYLSQLFQPTLDTLARRAAGIISIPAQEPTGWTRVDRNLDGIRQQLETSTTEEAFQAIGLRCREALISLGEAVFDPSKHVSTDGIAPSATDGFRMIEAFIAFELAGSSNETIRSHLKTSLRLANELQHRRTASLRDAMLCGEATRSVVNFVAIIANRR